MSRCHRCNGANVATFEVTVESHDDEKAHWSASLCNSCCGFVCAAIDGRALAAAGTFAKQEFGPKQFGKRKREFGPN